MMVGSLGAIGGVQVDGPLWLAPMAGITTPSVRLFQRRIGVSLVHTEMVSALGLKYRGEKSRRILIPLPGEEPVIPQLFGPSGEDLLEGARIALGEYPFRAVEVNMACPMPKVVSKGSGAAMLKDPDLAARAVALLKGLGVSVWVKARVLPGGFEETLRFCGRLFEAGLDLLLLHGRTSPQRYEGRADVEQVIRLSRAFPGRVVGSGDVFSPDDALRYLEGGCVAVLLARGFVRDPLLALRCAQRLGLRPPGDADLKGALLELGDMLASHEGERTCLILVKRMVAGALKGHPHDAERRNRVMSLKSWGDLREFILAWPL
ncbi:tRNA dihydrouridine synthase [Thermanaerovibrio acidaminovorans]|uniref:tRNA dihydrouridine synthase n=1 Tax=Thermanaerovibrio acidaminovorans TaxID=81462 RepID=UPI0024939EC9|nr:tRNA-dihydrouridine synthase family protein [Thermanaerovibrio acidaminovorans]